MRVYMLCVGLMILACGCLRAQESRCDFLKTSDIQYLRDFLQEQQRLRQSQCLSTAIQVLGQRRDIEAIHLLVGYLDYLDPKTGPLPNGGATVRPNYPAVDALFQIGKPATADLISSLEIDASPEVRVNALHAFEYIYRDDLWNGIRALGTAKRIAKSDEARRRLNDASKELMDDCKGRGEEAAKECENAAT